jgi:hypothetical protein
MSAQPLTGTAEHSIPFSTWNLFSPRESLVFNSEEDTMGLGRGALLWLLGVPLPIIILLALFWHH